MSDHATPPSPSSSATGADERGRHVELLVVIVMGITALLTAWAGFQSAKWAGEQSAAYSRANAARTESLRAATLAAHHQQIDVSTFIAWVDAVGSDDRARAEFVEDRFTDRLEPAFRAWLATNPQTDDSAPATPFQLPEYVVRASIEADELSALADAHADDAAAAASRVDRYVVMSVLFALVLLFTGISAKLREPRNRMIVFDIAVVGMVAGVVILALSPISL